MDEKPLAPAPGCRKDSIGAIGDHDVDDDNVEEEGRELDISN